MTNPLTGDFEAVLQVSGATVNRLLASMHQNAGANAAIPSFPHGIGIRIGDPTPIHGLKGTIYSQVSVPHIELIHGVSDRFWLDVSIRARYKADPGSAHLPEFIHGTVRAEYHFVNIDPSCHGWQKLASEYLWIRAIGDTVSFTGTAEDDSNSFSIIAAGADDPAAINARITQLVRYLMTQKFEATPHKVSRRFRRGSMRSLHVGGNRSVVAVPIGLTGEPSGDINSVNSDLLDGSDFGIGIDRDFIMRKIQEQLDAIKATPIPGISFKFQESVDLGFLGGFDVVTINIDWGLKLTSATAKWLGGSLPIPGLTLPGGLISISITGEARTQKAMFNWDFSVTQLLLLTFDAANETFVVAPFGPAAVSVTGTFSGIIEPYAKPQIQSRMAGQVQNAANSLGSELSLKGRKDELIGQLNTIDDKANAWFDHAVFTADGVMVRGRISLAGRRAPLADFKTTGTKDGYTAFDSWIPAGRIDSFKWSWTWLNNAGDPGSETITDRYLLSRPGGIARTKFGINLDLHQPLPGLDGMGQVCLVVSGVYVDAVTGDLVPLTLRPKCKRFGFDIRLATPGRVFLREWVPGPRDPIGPVAELAVHEVGGSGVQGHGANTLLVRIGSRWNKEIATSLREALSNSTRRDAGLVVLVLFNDNALMSAKPEVLSELREFGAKLDAPLVVNEDVGGSWSDALRMESIDGSRADVEWRLLSPTGGVTWAHSGDVDSAVLSTALDDYLFPSPIAGVTQIATDIPLGAQVTPAAFTSSISDHLKDGFTDAVIEAENTCPPPPFGRVGGDSIVAFVGKNSVASEAALRKLSSDHASRATETFSTVVFDGASAEDLVRLSQSLPDGVLAIADPDGSIANRFGVRVWPSNITINGNGVLTAFEMGFSPNTAIPNSGEAS